jgi:hypothetical protein
MKLRKLKFWDDQTVSDALPPAAAQSDTLNNVVQLPVSNALDKPKGLDSSELILPQAKTPIGPMSAEEIKAFFAFDYAAQGRYAGAIYKTNEALDHGKSVLVAQFQNAVSQVIDQKQAKVDGLRSMEVQTSGVSEVVTSQLRLACTRLGRDIDTLVTQRELALEGKGWILSALNEYQIGFGKGMRAAIDAELLGL